MATKKRVDADRDAERLAAGEASPVLTRFVLGETTFQSKGFSSIKITKKGEPGYLRLPIQSVGVLELKDELDRNIPKPPVKLRKLLKDSAQAKELGLTEDSTIQYFDATDPKYIEEFTAYKTDAVWQILLIALDVDFVDKTTQESVTDYGKRKEALKASGITGAHLDQILTDILKLTSDGENVADFLSGTAWG